MALFGGEQRGALGAAELPQFPPKKLCGNTEAKFVELRKRHLSLYLGQILKDNRVRAAAREAREFF